MNKIDFFGTWVTLTNPQQQVADIDSLLKTGKPAYVTYTNVHVVTTAVKDPALREAVNGAAIASPDGMPLVWLSRLKKHRDVSRCSGHDMMELLILSGIRKGYRHYFYGGTDEILDRLVKRLKEKYPFIRIAGMYAPPFHPLSDREQRRVMTRINACRPDFIWVGLGAPKQEIWMHRNIHLLRHGIMLGVGAAFDFSAGTKKRAPTWLRKAGLEWLYRLCSEPGRLFGRYLYTNTLFIAYLVRDAFLALRHKKAASEPIGKEEEYFENRKWRNEYE